MAEQDSLSTSAQRGPQKHQCWIGLRAIEDSGSRGHEFRLCICGEKNWRHA
jgi:hypothetical protein